MVRLVFHEQLRLKYCIKYHHVAGLMADPEYGSFSLFICKKCHSWDFLVTDRRAHLGLPVPAGRKARHREIYQKSWNNLNRKLRTEWTILNSPRSIALNWVWNWDILIAAYPLVTSAVLPHVRTCTTLFCISERLGRSYTFFRTNIDNQHAFQ